MNTDFSKGMTQEEFLRQYSRRKKRVMVYRVLILAAFILLWESSVRLGLIDAFIFSSPVRIVRSFLSLMQGGVIFMHIGITLFETLLSFFLCFYWVWRSQ